MLNESPLPRAFAFGQVANRYYRLECTHFMSSLGGDMLAILARDHLWMRVLSSASVMEPEV
jgi:hypothetical protein